MDFFPQRPAVHPMIYAYRDVNPDYDGLLKIGYTERTEELMLAMNAGARAIENTRRYQGAIYTKDVFLESPQEIPYLQAAKVLREVSDAPAADVDPVVHGRWIASHDEFCACSICKYPVYVGWNQTNYCPNCGAKMTNAEEEK